MRTDFPYIINAHEISHIPKNDGGLFSDFRQDIANKRITHPILHNTIAYQLTNVKQLTLQHYNDIKYAPESEVINIIRHDPELMWANDNSFDGLYIKKDLLREQMLMQYTIFAYMKPEHVTFMKLKY